MVTTPSSFPSNLPSPAIVAQEAVRRLPRLALVLLCVVYVLAGYVGREPWKSADMAAFGVMRDIALGYSGWLAPTLAGSPADTPALLPYWLGALAIKASPAWLPMDVAARIPFALLLVLTMLATWYGIYYLAKRPAAQPVPFAFGGEAQPTDYARCLADGGLLALLAMLGLAQLSHETTPAAMQLACVALLLYATAASAYHRALPLLAAAAATIGLALSGAPALGIALALTAAVTRAMQADDDSAQVWGLVLALLGALAATLALGLGQWPKQWGTVQMHWPTNFIAWRNLGRMFLWFTWPGWPLALIAVWKWRAWWRSLHIALPVALALLISLVTLLHPNADRVLLLALPSLACLAAFALPTLQRNATSLIDWFTVLFFSACGLFIWVYWVAMQTGWPSKPAANIRRLVPGFEAYFSFAIFLIAVCATLAWVWLAKWRVGRHRAALWKSLVLPAGGTALSWLLLMTLWMPLADFARSYAPLVRLVTQRIGQPDCVQTVGLSPGQTAAFSFHAQLRLKPVTKNAQCQWLIVDADSAERVSQMTNMRQWTLRATMRRPSDDNEDVLLFERRAP